MIARTSLNYIAEEIDSPSFTPKILQKLVQVKTIESSKGVNGGI
ncbi:MAG: Rrf2 family transcriptional regulator [Saprospiraceae bacterium]|nr:Rrf2 family transcriptional regulator [Saprospiraceae bacterium]